MEPSSSWFSETVTSVQEIASGYTPVFLNPARIKPRMSKKPLKFSFSWVLAIKLVILLLPVFF